MVSLRSLKRLQLYRNISLVTKTKQVFSPLSDLTMEDSSHPVPHGLTMDCISWAFCYHFLNVSSSSHLSRCSYFLPKSQNTIWVEHLAHKSPFEGKAECLSSQGKMQKKVYPRISTRYGWEAHLVHWKLESYCPSWILRRPLVLSSGGIHKRCIHPDKRWSAHRHALSTQSREVYRGFPMSRTARWRCYWHDNHRKEASA